MDEGVGAAVFKTLGLSGRAWPARAHSVPVGGGRQGRPAPGRNQFLRPRGEAHGPPSQYYDYAGNEFRNHEGSRRRPVADACSGRTRSIYLRSLSWASALPAGILRINRLAE